MLGLLLGLVAIAAPAGAQDLAHLHSFTELFGPTGKVSPVDEAARLAVSRLDLEAIGLEDRSLGSDASVFEVRLAEQQSPAPAPEHTGFKALVVDTGRDFLAFPRRRSTWVILGIGGAAAALAHPADDEVNDRLVGSKAIGRFFAPGKWIGAVYVQAGAAAGIYLVGRYMLPRADGAPRTNKVSHIGFDLLRAIVVSQVLTQGIKISVQRDRPTGECCAFPSGHASATFATASVLERHVGYRGAWPTFAVAAYVATSRLHDNRHFLSDVLFGASLGIASGWTVVGRHGRSNYALMPAPTPGGMMVALTRASAPLSVH